MCDQANLAHFLPGIRQHILQPVITFPKVVSALLFSILPLQTCFFQTLGTSTGCDYQKPHTMTEKMKTDSVIVSNNSFSKSSLSLLLAALVPALAVLERLLRLVLRPDIDPSVDDA